jgi:hypothetical protein
MPKINALFPETGFVRLRSILAPAGPRPDCSFNVVGRSETRPLDSACAERRQHCA